MPERVKLLQIAVILSVLAFLIDSIKRFYCTIKNAS